MCWGLLDVWNMCIKVVHLSWSTFPSKIGIHTRSTPHALHTDLKDYLHRRTLVEIRTEWHNASSLPSRESTTWLRVLMKDTSMKHYRHINFIWIHRSNRLRILCWEAGVNREDDISCKVGFEECHLNSTSQDHPQSYGSTRKHFVTWCNVWRIVLIQGLRHWAPALYMMTSLFNQLSWWILNKAGGRSPVWMLDTD